MCLFERQIINRKYVKNKKNRGVVPPIQDPRVLYVTTTCGECIECRKKKARDWKIRLLEDIKVHKNGKFITLTFSNESIQKLIDTEKIIKQNEEGEKQTIYLKNLEGYALDNAIATRAIHLFRERWRKEYGTSIRHWLVTELGHRGTQNIHLHGIIWTDEPMTQVEKIWQYGFIWAGYKINDIIIPTYVNEKTVNYITKYVSKLDQQHKKYKALTLTSPGIGKNYITSVNSNRNKYRAQNTEEIYISRTGHKMSLPAYWKKKLYTDQERKVLWIHKMNKQVKWIRGQKIDISKGFKSYDKILKWHQQQNRELGYGTGKTDLARETYEHEIRKMLYKKRTGTPSAGSNQKGPDI